MVSEKLYMHTQKTKPKPKNQTPSPNAWFITYNTYKNQLEMDHSLKCNS